MVLGFTEELYYIPEQTMALDSDEAVFRFVWSNPGPSTNRTYLSIHGYAHYMNECGGALDEFLDANAKIGSAESRQLFLSKHVINGRCVELCCAFVASAQLNADRQFRCIGHEDKQAVLDNGLYRQNAHNVRVANRQLKNGLARVRRELERRSKEYGFPEKMAVVANEYRQRANAVLEKFASTMANIQAEYEKSCARQHVYSMQKVELWRAHYRLFLAGAYVSGVNFPNSYVGRRLTVTGDELSQVKVGTYVHVENDDVYAQEQVISGFVNADNLLGSEGNYLIGRLQTFGSGPCLNPFSGIILKKEYNRIGGFSDESIEPKNDHIELIYDIIVIGSSNVFRYDQWDVLYSPVKEYIILDNVENGGDDNEGDGDTAALTMFNDDDTLVDDSDDDDA